jgi:hypothetical protein
VKNLWKSCLFLWEKSISFSLVILLTFINHSTTIAPTNVKKGINQKAAINGYLICLF